MIEAKLDASQLRDARKALKPGPHKRAMRKAGSEAVRKMKTAASRRIREEKNIKDRAIKKAMVGVRPVGAKSVERMGWGIRFRDINVPLLDYGARQTKKGVTVAVNKGGARTLIQSAFKATMPRTGHTGIFKRTSNLRLPIRELFGSRAVDQLLKPGEADKILIHGRDAFRKAFARLLPWERSR
jgi:hypothetical protein